MKTHSSLVTLASLLGLAGGCLAADWPYYNGADSQRTSLEAIAHTHWGADGPKALWQAETPAGFSSFTVGESLACTLVMREMDGINQETCVAFNAATGKEGWATPLGIFRVDHDGGNSGTPNNNGGDGPRSTPTIHEGKVYTLSSELALHCLDAKTGKVLWKHDLVEDFGARNIKWENAASPLVEGDGVYVCGGGKGESILCFDRKSGQMLWKDHDYEMTHASPVAATILGQRQVIFFTQKGLVSCEPKRGDVLWTYDFPYKVSTAASPVVFEDIVYCAAGYGVGAGGCRITKAGTKFKADEIWRSEGDKPVCNHWSTPVVKEGYLYGMFSFKEYGDGPVKCVDIRTGKEMWSKEGFGPGNLILAKDKLVALSDKGELVMIEPKPDAYTELARADVLDGKCWSTPTLAGGFIFARSTKEAACFAVAP